jgi:hypothetical protein
MLYDAALLWSATLRSQLTIQHGTVQKHLQTSQRHHTHTIIWPTATIHVFWRFNFHPPRHLWVVSSNVHELIQSPREVNSYFCSCHVHHNEETRTQRDKNTFFFIYTRNTKQTNKLPAPLYATSADRQLHIDNNPQNQNGKWQPK